jgi:hypothetical protein
MGVIGVRIAALGLALAGRYGSAGCKFDRAAEKLG